MIDPNENDSRSGALVVGNLRDNNVRNIPQKLTHRRIKKRPHKHRILILAHIGASGSYWCQPLKPSENDTFARSVFQLKNA
jgi:hypothetical protein